MDMWVWCLEYFGADAVRQALDNRKQAEVYSLNYPLHVANVSRRFIFKLRHDPTLAIAWFKSLPVATQHTLICCLVEDVGTETLNSLGISCDESIM
jgi:hypothetical protein